MPETKKLHVQFLGPENAKRFLGLAIPRNKLQGISPLDVPDFTQLGGYATFFPIVIASNKSTIKLATMQDFIAQAKARPGEINMSTAGVGQSWWIAGAFAIRKGTRCSAIYAAAWDGYSIS